jgi:tripeptide aminopeptidase
VVHYEGGALVSGVVDGREVATTPQELPDLDKLVGQDIVCSDGRTLLSADDKAGVAEIVALVARLQEDPSLPHPSLRIAFVPDEEIGHGAELLDIERFGAKWAYTVDGGPIGEFSYECFCASEATVSVRGVAVHPGTAKDIMVNALTVASEFQQMVPAAERPEHTSGREGFYHPIRFEGSSAEATLTYILRDFDADGLVARERMLGDIAATLNARYGKDTVRVDVRQQYRNMAEHLSDCGFLVDRVIEANREVGIEPWAEPIRGGTDGAQLTFRGLPCPNLAAGGYNMHSEREFVPVRSLELTVDMLEHLVAKFACDERK